MKNKLIILSGISGSGKSSATTAFEEMKYFIIANLPVQLLPQFLENFNQKEDQKTLIQIYIHHVEDYVKELKKHPEIDYDLILLTADEQELLNRYKFTRHAHPLQVRGYDLKTSLQAEFNEFEKVKDEATIRLDTTDIDVSTLRKTLFKRYRDDNKSEGKTIVMFISFGFKYGIPREIDVLFDVRAVPNPYYDKKLRNLTGKDQDVIDYLERYPITGRYNEDLITFLNPYLEDVANEGRSLVTIAVGCTGGQHRSVYFINELTKYFDDKYTVITIHRDIEKRQ